MKWTYSIKNKFSASIVLLSLCLLVLLSNYLDRKHAQNVKNSISTLYEDRLVAENHILEMTSIIYQIREIFESDLNTFKTNAVIKLIKDFNSTYHIYSKTKLTKTEKATATELISSFKIMEQTVLNNEFEISNTEKILVSLNKLSAIQLEESKLIMKNVEDQYTSIKVTSQFTFAIVILILVVLQVIVFSGESLIPVIKPNDPRHN